MVELLYISITKEKQTKGVARTNKIFFLLETIQNYSGTSAVRMVEM